MNGKRWLLGGTALAVAGGLAALVGNHGRGIEAASYELRPASAPVGAKAISLSVVVPAGTPRERLAAIRDEIRPRYPKARLLRIGFFDDHEAADRPQGPETPAPEPGWWRHYLAQYNLNRNTGYQWFGRLYPGRAEKWE